MSAALREEPMRDVIIPGSGGEALEWMEKVSDEQYTAGSGNIDGNQPGA